MEKEQEICQSLWKLALELEIEAERYDALSNDILLMAHELFDDQGRTLPSDAFEKYLGITKAQPSIKLKVNAKALVIERDLLVGSLVNPAMKNVVRSLTPFIFLPQTQEEQNILVLLNILYEEFESLASSYNLGTPFNQATYINLPQFKFYISLFSSAIQNLK